MRRNSPALIIMPVVVVVLVVGAVAHLGETCPRRRIRVSD